MRAAEEGAACLVAEGFAALAAIGEESAEIRMVGGAARSKRAVRLRAEACGVPVVVMGDQEGSMLGAAMCAAVAAERFAGFQQAAEAMVRVGTTVAPDRVGIQAMSEVRTQWRKVWQR